MAAPRDSAAYLHYFCAIESGNAEQLKDNEPKRLKLYKFVAALIRSYASIASELAEAGYKPEEIEKIKAEVDHYSKVRDEVRLASGDYIDLKAYEPAMRHLIDTYIRAEESEKISAFDDMSLIQLIVERGPEAADAKLKGVMKTEEAVAETIENNVRKLIINESPVDPAYYDKMSKLLDALIELRRKGVVSYNSHQIALNDVGNHRLVHRIISLVIFLRFAISDGMGGIPMRAHPSKEHLKEVIPGPAPMHLQAAVAEIEKPFFFHGMRDEAVTDARHFSLGIGQIQCERCTPGRHGMDFPIGGSGLTILAFGHDPTSGIS